MPTETAADAASISDLARKKAESYRMFDRIYRRYDLLNRMLSGGQDILWRNRVAARIKAHKNQLLLDLAAGTGDIALTILKKKAQVTHAHGCDMSRNMLTAAQYKANRSALKERISFIQGDAGSIPCPGESFDAVTMAFGIRNMVDPVQVLKEIHRVLKSGGRALVLEFSLPSNKVIRKLHLFYLRRIIPHVGALISKDKHAYRYLNETIETFPYGDDFRCLMEQAGFADVQFTPLTFGVATIYQGEKK